MSMSKVFYSTATRRGLVAGACIMLIATAAYAFEGQELAHAAKISIDDARKIALKVQPGKIAKEELEHERGGSGLRYTFDITNKGRTYEVGVDALNGNILENAIEDTKKD